MRGRLLHAVERFLDEYNACVSVAGEDVALLEESEELGKEVNCL